VVSGNDGVSQKVLSSLVPPPPSAVRRFIAEGG
jgi:hypothetical protein